MKKSDLKKMLKPVILECLKEILAEEFIRKVTNEEIVATLSESKSQPRKQPVVQENRKINMNVPTSSISNTLRAHLVDDDTNPYGEALEPATGGNGVSYSNTDPNFGRQFVSKSQLDELGLKRDWSKHKF